MEDFEGDLAKRKSCWPVEVCWGSVDSQRGELKNINQFRTISLLSVEGKVFSASSPKDWRSFSSRTTTSTPQCRRGDSWSSRLLGTHWCSYTTHQRGPWEQSDLVVLWLDLANAYGSIPHKLVELALHLHHVPCKIKDLILDYYNNFRMRVTSGSATSDWHCIRKGIITGCTISVFFSLLPWTWWSSQLRWNVEGP